MKTFPGRYTETGAEDVTIFLIGARVNGRHFRRILPVARAARKVIAYLGEHPESGMLGAELFRNGRTTLLLSYWTTAEMLRRFASDSAAPHAEVWRDFTRTIGNDGSVGIWHETYVVPATSREAVYVNMPIFGLAGAVGHGPVGAGRHTAKQRMTATGTEVGSNAATGSTPPGT